jgi:hypothetical protein
VVESMFFIYRNLHLKKWIFNHIDLFFYVFKDKKDSIIELSEEINSILESHKLQATSEKLGTMVDLSLKISLLLMVKDSFNENSFHEFIKTSQNFLNYINNNESDRLLYISFFDCIFSSLENVLFN